MNHLSRSSSTMSQLAILELESRESRSMAGCSESLPRGGKRCFCRARRNRISSSSGRHVEVRKRLRNGSTPFKKGPDTVERSTRPTFGRCPAVPATVSGPFLNHALDPMCKTVSSETTSDRVSSPLPLPCEFGQESRNIPIMPNLLVFPVSERR